MDTIDKFKETILKEYPRLSSEEKFKFSCYPGISCFNKCCQDVNIFLTPYDILRLKNRLGISSGEFLEKYTILPIDENLKHPIVMLKMEDDTLKCPFVKDDGCSVYGDRPWSCRMYPLGVASPKEVEENGYKEFYFLLQEKVCQGLKENKEWTVLDWIQNQGVEEYAVFGDLFKDLSLNNYFVRTKAIEPVKLEMFYMVCYDIDKFREFVFGSSILRRFVVDEFLIENIKGSDEELLKFGFQFLKFSLFGEKTLKVREEYLKAG